MTAKDQPELPILYGAPYSVYVRIVRLVLLEKKVEYTLKPIDIFDDNDDTKRYERINPFKKIPSFSYAGTQLFETSAITRFIDDVFPKPSLVPSNTVDRAKANQIISIIDNHAYPSMIWGVYVPLVEEKETHSDAKAVQDAMATAETVLTAIDGIKGKNHPYFFGDDISLADIYAVPLLFYFLQTEIGMKIIARHQVLLQWWKTVSNRPGYMEILDPR